MPLTKKKAPKPKKIKAAAPPKIQRHQYSNEVLKRAFENNRRALAKKKLEPAYVGRFDLGVSDVTEQLKEARRCLATSPAWANTSARPPA